MTPGTSGLVFLAFGIGAAFAVAIFLVWDRYVLRAQDKSEKWSFRPEFRRLPIACLGGPLWAAGLFWIGWSAERDIHWLAPASAQIVLGTGYLLIFMVSLPLFPPPCPPPPLLSLGDAKLGHFTSRFLGE